MSTSLSVLLKSTARRRLPALASLLAQGEEHAKASGYDSDVLMNARLYPDMLPLAWQVRIACDLFARGAARLAGGELPSFADDETTLTALRARIEAALAFVESQDDAALDADPDAMITAPAGRDKTITLSRRDFVLQMMFPNIYFHLTTTYALLRHNGVPLGKMDFIGQTPELAPTA